MAGISLDGMVCAWWFDGNRMFEPYIKKKCRMIVVDDQHPAWPGDSTNTGTGGGGGHSINQRRHVNGSQKRLE